MTRLQKARLEQGLSQSELAGCAQISVRTLQALEQGRRDINKASAETVLRLSKALRVQMTDIMEDLLW